MCSPCSRIHTPSLQVSRVSSHRVSLSTAQHPFTPNEDRSRTLPVSEGSAFSADVCCVHGPRVGCSHAHEGLHSLAERRRCPTTSKSRLSCRRTNCCCLCFFAHCRPCVRTSMIPAIMPTAFRLQPRNSISRMFVSRQVYSRNRNHDTPRRCLRRSAAQLLVRKKMH